MQPIEPLIQLTVNRDMLAENVPSQCCVRDKLTKRETDIENGIFEKASGVFMWVVLVVALLNQAYDWGQVEVTQETLC